MKSEFPGAVPEIPVRDIATAAAYYRDSLGFALDWGDEELGLAGISRGDCRMFLANQQYRKAYGNVGPTLTWLNLESKEEVDENAPRKPDTSDGAANQRASFRRNRRPGPRRLRPLAPPSAAAAARCCLTIC